MMNTGYVGGDQREVSSGKALKVKIAHSNALLEALFAGNIAWKKDPDFGYEYPDPDSPANAQLLQLVPASILEPRRLFIDSGRGAIYTAWVQQMHAERRLFLEKFKVSSEIINAVCAAQ